MCESEKVDLYNVELPENAGEDSFSFLDELNGNKVDEQRQNAVLLSGAAYSFIEGDWKLIDFSYSVRNPQEKSEVQQRKKLKSFINK